MAAHVSCDVCDLSRIYEPGGFCYSLPEHVLKVFFSGKAFDNKQPYSEEEQQRLRDDINEMYQEILSSDPVKGHEAVITAGAPGAGKTVCLRKDLESQARTWAYVDPDDFCLRAQKRTFLADLEKCDGSKEARQAIYNKWRPGSNAAMHVILANLLRDRYSLYFGTTSTGDKTGVFFKFFVDHGYTIRLIHLTAPDDVRWASIQKRDETFVQTTEEDVRQKGLLLPQRINDTFLAFAQTIEFRYRRGVEEDSQLGAVWERNPAGSKTTGTLRILSPDVYEKIKATHNAGAQALNREDLRWDLTVEKHSTIVSLS